MMAVFVMDFDSDALWSASKLPPRELRLPRHVTRDT